MFASGFWPAGLVRWERDQTPAGAAEGEDAPRTDPETHTPPLPTADTHRDTRQEHTHTLRRRRRSASHLTDERKRLPTGPLPRVTELLHQFSQKTHQQSRARGQLPDDLTHLQTHTHTRSGERLTANTHSLDQESDSFIRSGE